MELRAEDHMAVAVVADQLGGECGQVASCLVRYPLVSHREILRLSGLGAEQTSLALATLIRYALVHFIDVPQISAGALGQQTLTLYTFHSRAAYCMAYAPKVLAAVGRTSLLEAEILRHYLVFGAEAADAVQAAILSRHPASLQGSLGPADFDRAFRGLVSAGYAVPLRLQALAMKRQMLTEYLVRCSLREEDFRARLGLGPGAAGGAGREAGRGVSYAAPRKPRAKGAGRRGGAASGAAGAVGAAGSATSAAAAGADPDADADAGAPGTLADIAGPVEPADALLDLSLNAGPRAPRQARLSSGAFSPGLPPSGRAVDPPAEPAAKRRLPDSAVSVLSPGLREILDYSPGPAPAFSREEPFTLCFEALLSAVKTEAIVADYQARYSEAMATVARACLAVAGCPRRLVSLPLFRGEREPLTQSVPVERIVEYVNQCPPPGSAGWGAGWGAARGAARAAAYPSELPSALAGVAGLGASYAPPAGVGLDGLPGARGEGAYSQAAVYRCLEALASSPTPLIGLRDQAVCDVRATGALRALQARILDQLLERRHGPGAVRVVRLLRLRGNLEPQTVAAEVMLPLSTASSLLMTMHQEGLLRAFQLPKTADYNPDYTTFLYGEDPEYYNKLTEVLVKIIFNVWQKNVSLHASERAATDPQEVQAIRTQRGCLEYVYARLLDLGVFFV